MKIKNGLVVMLAALGGFSCAVYADDDWDDDRRYRGGDIISVERAIDIAKDRVGGGRVEDVDLDSDDGRRYYEIEIERRGLEYEVKVDARTGRVLEVDVDD